MDTVDSMKSVLDQIALPPPIVRFEGDAAADDSPLRVWLVSPAQYNKFAAQPGFRQFQASSLARTSQARQHPIFLGECGLWNGFLIRKMPKPIRFYAGDEIRYCAAYDSEQESVAYVPASFGTTHAVDRSVILGGQALAEAMGKEEVDVLFTALSNLQPLEKAGKVKLIAIANGKKSLAAPHLPTLHESGFRGFDATTWNGFFAPANTPESVIQQLHKEIAKILAQPEVQERLLKVGAETVPIISPAEFGTMVKKETAEWKKVIHDAGLSFD